MRTGQLNGIEYTYTAQQETDLDAVEALHDSNPVPHSVTRYQAKIALRRAGEADNVKTVLDDPGTDPEIVEAWNDKSIFERNSPAITVMATALGFNDAQVDNLFRTAALIE